MRQVVFEFSSIYLIRKKFRQINECQKIQLLRLIHMGFEKVWVITARPKNLFL